MTSNRSDNYKSMDDDDDGLKLSGLHRQQSSKIDYLNQFASNEMKKV